MQIFPLSLNMAVFSTVRHYKKDPITFPICYVGYCECIWVICKTSDYLISKVILHLNVHSALFFILILIRLLISKTYNKKETHAYAKALAKVLLQFTRVFCWLQREEIRFQKRKQCLRKKHLVRLNPTFLDISSHCYTDDNVKVVCSELYKYSQHGTVYGSNCANIKICSQIIWKSLYQV